MPEMLEQRVRELKDVIAGNDGTNAADVSFVRAVDELVSSLYDDITQIRCIPIRAVFDLFVIKVLYVGRRSTHADVIDYLGALLESCLYARVILPEDAHGRARKLYFSDMTSAASAGEPAPEGTVNIAEAYRMYADGALFLSGVFAASTQRRRPSPRSTLRRRSAPAVDREYYIETGKVMYRMSARDDHAACEHRSRTLGTLADHFELYVDALGEMSERYITGFDMGLIADKMLDGYNAWRTTGNQHQLAEARGYASILNIDPAPFVRTP